MVRVLEQLDNPKSKKATNRIREVYSRIKDEFKSMGDYINDPHFDGISKDEYDMLMDILSKIYSEIGEFTISCAGMWFADVK